MHKIIVLLASLSVICCSDAFAWTPESNITPTNTYWLNSTAIAADSNNVVHLIYAKSVDSLLWEICDRYQTANGFSAEQAISPLNIKEPVASIVAGSSGKLFLISLGMGGTWDTYTVFFREWNGSAWSSALQLSDGTSACDSPAIAVDSSGSLHVVWSQVKTGNGGDIMYRKRTAAGQWGAAVNLTANNPGTSFGSVSPDIACDYSGNGVHIVWQDDYLSNGFQTYYMKSTDSGSTWPTQGGWILLSSANSEKDPHVVVDRTNNVHTFWMDASGLIYRRTTTGQWGSPIALGAITYMESAVDSSNTVHILYSSCATGTSEIYHDTLTATGLSGKNELISSGANTCKTASGSLTIDKNNTISIAWQELKDSFSANPGIYFSKSAGTIAPATTSVSDLRSQPDGSTVSLDSKLVTAAFGGCFYIEETNRAAGIKVLSNDAMAVGNMVSFTGTLETIGGERQITVTGNVTVISTDNPVPGPLAWNVRAIGGATLQNSPGISQPYGLNNIGLLGRVAGKITGTGFICFYVDDGSNIPADEGFTGVKVISDKPVQTGQTVIVTGISSVAINSSSQPIRQLKTRNQSDVQIL